MEKRVVVSAKAPRPVGPYSQAIQAGELIFMSGQIGLDPATGEIVEGGVEAQADQCLKNLAGVLLAMGLDLSAIVKTTIFLTDMNDFAAVNAVYAGYFPENPPARSTIAVKELPLGVAVEIEAVAIKNR